MSAIIGILCFADHCKPKADLPMSKNKQSKQCDNLCQRVPNVISILGVLVPKATLDMTHGKKICIDGQWILFTCKGEQIAAFQSELDLVNWWMAVQKMAGREGFVSHSWVAQAPPGVPELGASSPWQSSGEGNSMRDWDFD